MDAPLALYRRHRPETFAQVIGQDHVTRPLRTALANNRVNHAYLFSGPRGCGKTTSARILARALNCERGPAPEPCGECQSCRDLARGGPGSIDVIEIDAASHGGVDDARDLRERAFFSPVSSRYKVYIIDEAHMVTTQGFNALLKLVEEPPDHLKFIFATTEPDKVIGTIRSRTHHYPFRLIAPRTLSAYLGEICEAEGVQIEPAALPLVVRAGGGSARDALSILDQLIGGASEAGVTHELASALLGYTPESLLDDVVDAFAAGDGASVFGAVDRVIETGQDPRRFTEDLLRRLRDLVIISAVPDAPATGLIDVPEDQAERLVAQAARFGRVELSRAADLVAVGLTELKGATAPRLLLELICARVLLPGADDSIDGVMARLERLERRVAIEGGAPELPAQTHARSAAPTPKPAPASAPAKTAPARPAPSPAAMPTSEPAPGTPTAQAAGAAPEPAQTPADVRAAQVDAQPEASAEAGTGSVMSLTEVRRLWPELLERVKLKRRFTWILLSQNAQVADVDAKTLTIALLNSGARDSFTSSGSDEILRQAAIDVVGVEWRVDAIVDPSAQPGSEPGSEPRVVRSAVFPDAAGDETGQDPVSASATAQTEDTSTVPVVPQSAAPVEKRALDPESVSRAREAIKQTRGPGGPEKPDPALGDAEAHRDDPDADDHGLDSAELLERELGASLIEEIRHQ